MIPFFHAGLFYILISLSCASFSVFIYVMRIFGIHQVLYRINRIWAYCFLLWCRVCGLKYTVQGIENFPKEPCVFLVRHESAWETIAMQYILPPSAIVFKQSLLWVPFFGLSLLALGFIPIARHKGVSSFKKVFALGERRLKRGLCVVFFPEGKRVSAQDFPLFYRSGAYLAKHAGVPVIPICHNAGDFWQRNQFVKKAGTIIVKIGPCIDTQNLSVEEINKQAYQWVYQNRVSG